MSFKDHFSAHAGEYARHRPHYPAEMFEYLASVARGHELAWDCGTGNGQAALGLTPYFERVIATDPSDEQLRNAFRHEKITYRLAQAENAGLDAGSVDLVTVAQALHWFDYMVFYEEARQALRPGGVLAVWCYTLCRVSPEVDKIIDTFYFDTVGPYWPKERLLVDDGYRSMAFPFDEFETPRFQIELLWSLEDMLAYLRTWSPMRRYFEAHGRDPVHEVAAPLGRAWGDAGPRPVRWPIVMRAGYSNAEFGVRNAE
jgi:SAM-dependent methyltransferase